MRGHVLVWRASLGLNNGRSMKSRIGSTDTRLLISGHADNGGRVDVELSADERTIAGSL
jgi:hypothetical protein